MKTWTVLLKHDNEIFLLSDKDFKFKKTLQPRLMTKKEAKDLSDMYREYQYDAKPFDTENNIEKIKELYNGKRERK